MKAGTTVIPSVECLGRLQPHLRVGGAAVTGSLAIHLHLTRMGKAHSRPVEDLDLVATDSDVVKPAVVHDFLVSHYHSPTLDQPKFFVQLVDPISACRVDVFPDISGVVPKAEVYWVHGRKIPVVRLTDLLDHKLATLTNARSNAPVDPKHLQDVQTLAHVLGRPVPALPEQHSTSESYSTDTSSVCPRCEMSRSLLFPLSAKARILAILGYV